MGLSGIEPRVLGTWLLEVTPVLLGMVILVTTYSRFRFTTLAYRALAFGALFMALGAHYSYADARRESGCVRGRSWTATPTTGSGTWSRGR